MAVTLTLKEVTWRNNPQLHEYYCVRSFEYLSLFEYVHTERKITGEIRLVIQEIGGHVD